MSDIANRLPSTKLALPAIAVVATIGAAAACWIITLIVDPTAIPGLMPSM
jgi:hypothetical protein